MEGDDKKTQFPEYLLLSEEERREVDKKLVKRAGTLTEQLSEKHTEYASKQKELLENKKKLYQESEQENADILIDELERIVDTQRETIDNLKKIIRTQQKTMEYMERIIERTTNVNFSDEKGKNV
jgi:DNA anti-recombination protein RmuC